MVTYSRQEIAILCREVSARDAADPALFDYLVEQLAAAGVAVNRELTQEARAQGPNVVLVYDTYDGPDYIALLDGSFEVEGYYGEPTAELIAASEVERWYPDLDQGDLRELRYVEREGEKFFDSADIYRIADEKDAERAAARVMTLVLPDEFLVLCENVMQIPATVIQGFIADLCHLERGEYITNGGHERDLAQEYFRRCGYRFRAKANEEEDKRAAG